MVGRLGVRRREAIVFLFDIEGAGAFEVVVVLLGIGLLFMAVFSILILMLPCTASLLGNASARGLEVGRYDRALLLIEAGGNFNVASGLIWFPSMPANKLKPASPVVR
jgi:hypothetical protein